jgi:hypothetical protein
MRCRCRNISKVCADSTERWVIDLLALAYHAEYGIPVDQQSSLNLVDIIGTDAASEFAMFGDSDEAHRIAGGSGTLPETLLARLSVAPLAERVRVNLRHELANIAHEGGGFRLTFKNESKPPVERSFERVVLALPFTRLREVNGLGGLGLSAEKDEGDQRAGLWREFQADGRHVIAAVAAAAAGHQLAVDGHDLFRPRLRGRVGHKRWARKAWAAC